MEEKPKIILYRESFVQSVLSDCFTFGVLAGLLVLNQFVLDGNKFSGFIFILIGLITLASKVSNKKRTFTSKKELQNFVDSLE